MKKLTNDEILTSLSELIRSLSRIANNHPKIMYKNDMDNLLKAQDILSSNTEINENEIPKGSKLPYEEILEKQLCDHEDESGQYWRGDYVLIAMSQAVQQRDEEIKEWIELHKIGNSLHYIEINYDKFKKFLNQ